MSPTKPSLAQLAAHNVDALLAILSLPLFLITHNHKRTALSALLLFLVLVTLDIATRILTHRNIRAQIGETP